MGNKLLICCFLELVVMMSIYTLLLLIFLPGDHIDPPYRVRYIYFLGIHIMLFVSILIGILLQKIYHYCILVLVNCIIIIIAVSICEEVVLPLEKNAHYYYQAADATSQKMQLIYLVLYYIVFTYAIIGFFVCTVFITATQILIRYEEKMFNEHIEVCLQTVEDLIGQVQCAICLEQTKDNNKHVKVRVCRHLFHRACLIQWLTHNSTCPLCRKDIFGLSVQDEPRQRPYEQFLEEQGQGSERDSSNGEGQFSLQRSNRLSREASQVEQSHYEPVEANNRTEKRQQVANQ